MKRLDRIVDLKRSVDDIGGADYDGVVSVIVVVVVVDGGGCSLSLRRSGARVLGSVEFNGRSMGLGRGEGELVTLKKKRLTLYFLMILGMNQFHS
ncbi:hypothetical protein EYC84_002786 [Monilinia fructicola]|uniref:Uncharacterized protein n=1 Tax=Monilinia fructicola TaxID=38448 RepID=A0A5M9JP88_MONFR|nr:hypothetical protein EYC84_002786 [Monilinia fructicola]